MKHVPELDGLRGLAVTLVIFHHYLNHPALSLYGPRWGWAGVNLFFVLSGYLITSILLRTRASQSPIKTFYARRILRIFPLYYLVVLFWLACSAILHTPQSWKTAAYYLLFLQAVVSPHAIHLWIIPHPVWADYSVLWSLSVEEVFYLLWAPLVIWMVARNRILIRCLIGVLVVAPVIRYFYIFYPTPAGIQQTFLGQMDSLAAGALLAILWMLHAEDMRTWGQAHARWLNATIGILLAGAICLDLALGVHVKTPMHLRIFDTFEYTLLWAAWSVLLFSALVWSGQQRMLTRFLRNRTLCWLGKISYCLYLVHVACFMFWREHLPHIIALPVSLVSSLAIAALSWKYLEGPIMNWKKTHAQYVEAKIDFQVSA